jgi:hypothetical protein
VNEEVSDEVLAITYKKINRSFFQGKAIIYIFHTKDCNINIILTLNSFESI